MAESENKNTKPSIAGTIIDESVTKQDFELTKLYQAYSSELLRIAIAGIAIVGFLIQHLKLLEKKNNWVNVLIGAGMISLAVSSAFALLHRYFSTDSMAYFIAHLRAKTYLQENKDIDKKSEELLEIQKKNEIYEFKREIKKCDKYLKNSAVALGIGFVFIVSGIVLFLFM
jgi:hypothetical protein